MSATRSFSFPFQASSTQTADETVVLDEGLERRLYMEVVCALQGAELDEAVVAIYSDEPARDMPTIRDSRRSFRRYSSPE